MKIKIAAFIAGILGILGVLLFLIAFGTDYWLLATEACGGFEPENNTLHTKEEARKQDKEGGRERERPSPAAHPGSARGSAVGPRPVVVEYLQGQPHPKTSQDGIGEQKNDSREVLTFHHEGFFWRCWFFGDYKESIWTFWFTSQGHPKHCMNGYLFPMPIALGPYPHPSYDATAVYRGFWTAFIVLAITSSLVGGFLLVCGVPFVNARFYKVGGGFLITAGILFALLIFLFVMWKELAADLNKYILLERNDQCEDENPIKVYYGWSFIFAAAGVPLVLLSGLLFYLVGYSILKEQE